MRSPLYCAWWHGQQLAANCPDVLRLTQRQHSITQQLRVRAPSALLQVWALSGVMGGGKADG